MTRILIADDISANRYMLTSLLEGSGYEVVSAADGAEALALAKSAPPDLIVTDIMMPVMDGFELCRLWKSDDRLKHIPFVIYTATYTDPKDEKLARNLGADRFLLKPQKVERLLEVVREVLAEASRGGSNDRPGLSRDEMDLVRQHNDALLRKLQRKVGQLEAALEERNRAEGNLRRTNAFLDSIIENVPDMIFLKDARELRFVRFNRAGEELLGYARAELVGKRDHDFFPEDQADFFTEKDREVLRGKTIVEIPEEPLETKDKGRRIVRTKKVPILNADGEAEYLLGISEDITDVKQAEEEHRKLEGQLRESQKLEAIGRLAGGVAHDFNNLLTVVLGHTGFAIETTREGEPLRADLEAIQKAGERAAALTRQLLAFSRRQVLEPDVLNLNTVVTSVESMLRRLLGEDIEIVTRLDDDLGNVLVDPGQLEQVLMNLAVNARDAMPSGGRLTLATENVEIDEDFTEGHLAVDPGEFVMLAVTDTGCGMDAATRAQIFEPFFTTKEKGKGTGLGLSTVFGIVKQSGGGVWVYSEAGQGTTFKVFLPRVVAAASKPKHRAAPVLAVGNKVVLLVEDDDTVRRIAERILDAAGYRVQAASNGDEALLVCEKLGGEVDLLLTDVVMPGMNGRELAERITRHCPRLKTLYMSGFSDDGIVPRAARFIGKPFSAAELTQKVREVLDEEPG